MATPIITTNNLFYRYGDGTEALKGISITLNQGKKIAILGNNGAGKSTFFLHLNGILKPLSGSITFKGKRVQYTKKYLQALRQKVGIIFQNPDEQLFSPTVFEDISYGPRNLGLTKDAIERLVHWAMKETGTLELQKKATHSLSIGQKKRVSIACVLSMDPELLILDEPTAGLDSYYAKKIINLLNQINRDGKTIVLSTHDINFAFEWADEIIILHDGKVLGNGGREEIFLQKDLFQKANLERPMILDLYQFLIDNDYFPTQKQIPRTKEDLLKLLSISTSRILKNGQ